MGLCPSLSPQERANARNNKQLQKILIESLKDLYMYSFCKNLQRTIPNIPSRYMFNEGIFEDIQKIVNLAESDREIIVESVSMGNFDQDIRNSCLILEDEAVNKKLQEEGKQNDKMGTNDSTDVTSFMKNMAQHQSLVCQMNIIYERDFQMGKYEQSLRLFLKWSNIFQQHAYGGFLKPVYRQFCQSLYKIPIQQFDTIIDQTCVFVQYMVGIYTSIYELKRVNSSINGDLFKNQNIYNLIMSFLFKKTKIKKFLRHVIQTRENQKIKAFAAKIEKLGDKTLQFFEVEPKFQLNDIIEEGEINSMTDVSQNELAKRVNSTRRPYSGSERLVESLCDPGQTPITKLKIIVAISKSITKEICEHYDQINKQVPDLDPDNLTGIIMYLVVRCRRPELLEQLKMVEYFTTTNCMTCISGYYLNTFNAAIETLLTLE